MPDVWGWVLGGLRIGRRGTAIRLLKAIDADDGTSVGLVLNKTPDIVNAELNIDGMMENAPLTSRPGSDE